MLQTNIKRKSTLNSLPHEGEGSRTTILRQAQDGGEPIRLTSFAQCPEQAQRVERHSRTTISFNTLGCRLNQSETAVIQRTFESGGYKIVDFNQPADVVVINTCTVTEHGDADTRHLVNKINRINPRARIALIGCQAQIQKEKLLNLSNVHWVVGNAKKMDLVSILNDSAFAQGPQVIAPTIPRTSFTLPIAGVDRDHTRANLKIQDGCDFFCSFCEIPYARGRARSREFEDILREAKALVTAGHKELVLTGINLGTYQYEEKKILNVIDALAQIKGLMRLRISSIEPTTIPFELFERMAPGSKLCRYLHIPIQSGHDEILHLMKRKYTVKKFRNFIEKVYNLVPEIGLGTDVIVGFPGETPAHFEQTYQLLRDLPLAYFHVFSYSQRQFAQSQNLSNPLKTETIQTRSKMLRDLSVRKRQLFIQNLIGSVQKVLFEEKKDGTWTGLTDHYVRVKVASENDLHNQIRDVSLDRLDGQMCMGKLCAPNMSSSNI